MPQKKRPFKTNAPKESVYGRGQKLSKPRKGIV